LDHYADYTTEESDMRELSQFERTLIANARTARGALERRLEEYQAAPIVCIAIPTAGVFDANQALCWIANCLKPEEAIHLLSIVLGAPELQAEGGRQMRSEFHDAWEYLSRHGFCDAINGSEYRSAWRAYQSSGGAHTNTISWLLGWQAGRMPDPIREAEARVGHPS
jgi:hypothetical protein